MAMQHFSIVCCARHVADCLPVHTSRGFRRFLGARGRTNVSIVNCVHFGQRDDIDNLGCSLAQMKRWRQKCHAAVLHLFTTCTGGCIHGRLYSLVFNYHADYMFVANAEDGKDSRGNTCNTKDPREANEFVINGRTHWKRQRLTFALHHCAQWNKA
jgi:hypothetical protein